MQQGGRNQGRSRTARSGPVVWLWRALLYGGLALLWYQGQPVTRAVAAAALIVAALGDRDGLARHVIRMVGVAVAGIGALLLGGELAELLEPTLDLSYLSARLLGFVGVFIGIILVVGAVGGWASRALRRRPVLGGLDRMAGSGFGALEGALIVSGIVWTAALFEKPMQEALARLPIDSPGSASADVYEGVQRFYAALDTDPVGRQLVAANPLPRISFVQDAGGVLAALSDREMLMSAPELEPFRELAQRPEVQRHVQAIREDPGLREAIQRMSVREIVAHPRVAEMLDDRELFAVVSANWDELWGALAQAGRAGGEFAP